MYSFPKEFDFNVFKSISSFRKRISYCNLKLYKLGSGSSRCVYMVDQQTVLKVAKNEKGIAQNDAENDSFLQDIGLFPEIYDADTDGKWIISQLARKAKKRDFEDILGVRFEFICAYIDYCCGQYSIYIGNSWWRDQDYDEKFNEIISGEDYYGSIYEQINIYLSNYTLESVGDLKRLANWGVVEDGENKRLVVVDAGFNDETSKLYCGETKQNIIDKVDESYDNDNFILSCYEDYSDYDLLDEFKSDKENGIKSKKWDVIPKDQYKNLLLRYMSSPTPEMARIPKNVVYSWFVDIIVRNTMAIEYITSFAGHSSYFNPCAIEDCFGKDIEGYDDGSEFLDKIGFYDWCKLPDGSDAWSDYGVQPLYDIILEYNDNMEGWEILMLINRCLDVWHHRGDLASAFIEGGSRTCSEISGI